MRCTRTPLLLALVLAGGCLVAAAQAGADPGDRMWWKDAAVAEQLNLTPAQRDAIETIVFESGRRAIDLRAEVAKARLELARFLSAEAIDAAAAEKMIDKISAAECAAVRAKVESRVKVAQVLTAEQRVQLIELSERPRRPSGRVGPRGRQRD